MKGLLFTYGLCFGGAVAALFNPFVGLLVYIAFAILKPDALWWWSVPQWNYSRVVGIALLVGWALHGCGSWNLGRARGMAIAISGFLAWSVVSALQAPDQERAWNFVDNILKIALPVVVGITLIDSVARLKQLAWVIVLSQGFLAYDANVSFFSGRDFREYALPGIPDNNGLALTMHTCAALAFILGLQSPGWWRKLVAFGAAGLMVHAVLFSFSREGILGLLVSAVVAFLLVPKRPWHFVVFTLAVVLALRLAGPEVRERFATVFVDPEERDLSAQSRVKLWGDCYDAMMEKPFFGHGPRHFPLIAQKYGWTEGKEGHTLWLQIGAELGVPGLAFLLGYFGLCAFKLWPITRSPDSTRDPWLADGARMVIASLAGFFVCTQFNGLYTIEVPYYVALLGAGVIKLSDPIQASATASASPHPLAASSNNLSLS